MRFLRIWLGLAVWAGAVWAAWLFVAGTLASSAPDGHRVVDDLWDYSAGKRQVITLVFAAPQELAVSDPILVRDDAGSLRQVGEIRALVRTGAILPYERASVAEARAVLFPSAPPLGPHSRLTYFANPDSIRWVMNTLLTPERKRQARVELARALEDHHDELMAALQPVVETTIRDGMQVLAEELPLAIERHRGALEALADRYQVEVVDGEIIPLVKTEIWPSVLRRSEPTVNEVGHELWERVSLWRFAWRLAYDRAPLPGRRLVDSEWKRFVEREAIPILLHHSDDFVAVVKEVIQDASQNEQIQTGVRRNLSRIAGDPEFRAIVWQIFDETVVRNARLQEVLERDWTGPEAERAMQVAAERLEPAVRRVADTLFGTLDEGITPEFAQVLRAQILAKDRRSLVLEYDPSATAPPAGQAPAVLPVEGGVRDPFSPVVRARLGTRE